MSSDMQPVLRPPTRSAREPSQRKRMLADDDAPPDVKKATSVAHAIQKGEKDDTFEGNPRVQKKRRKWVHCDERKPKPRKTEGDGGCCQSKREKKRQRAQKLAKITIYGKSCDLPKVDVVPRHCLTKDEHLQLLAKPKRRCPPECDNKVVTRQLRPISPRVRELAKPTRRRVLMTLRQGATRLPASFLDNLVNALEEESCMTPEQAASVTRSRKAKKKTKVQPQKEARGAAAEWGYGEATPPKAKKAAALNTSPMDKEAVICQYLMAERFVKSILKRKCPTPRDEFSDIAQVLIKRLASTLEYTPTEDEDRKSQQMRFLADIIACWISGVITEVAQAHEKELEERCKKKEEQRKALEEEEDEDSDDDRYDDDKYGGKDDGKSGLSDYDDNDGSRSILSRSKSKEKSLVSMKTDKSVSEQPVDEEAELAVQYGEKASKETEAAASREGAEEEKLRAGESEKSLKSGEQDGRGPSDTKVGMRSEGAEMEQAMGAFDEDEAAKVGLPPEGTKTASGRDLTGDSVQAKVDSEAVKDAAGPDESDQVTDQSLIKQAQMDQSADGPLVGTPPAGLTPEESRADESGAIADVGGIQVAAAISGKSSALALGEKGVTSPDAVPSLASVTSGGTPGVVPSLTSAKSGGSGWLSKALSSTKVKQSKTTFGEELIVTEKEIEAVEKGNIRGEAIGPSGEQIPPMLGDRAALEELLYKADIPFHSFDKIIDTIHKMVEDSPMNTGENASVNNLHRMLYEKLSEVVAMDSPDLLTAEMKQKLDVTCGKIATWLQTLLSQSQIAYMEKIMPEVESKEIREWLQWLCYLCNAATDWNTWLRGIIEEMKVLQDVQMTRAQWQQWTKRVDKGALLWRLFHLEAKHRARKNFSMMTDRQVFPTGNLQKGRFQISEQILQATDLHA